MRGKRFCGKTRGKRQLGKPNYRWDWENVKMNLESKEKGRMWIGSNCLWLEKRGGIVPQNATNFLTSE
jgi:hypothetical protein